MSQLRPRDTPWTVLRAMANTTITSLPESKFREESVLMNLIETLSLSEKSYS